MFECDGQLRTWSTVTWDLADPTEREWDCEPLAPHRLHYLDYEGSVSGDRGFVERVISGTYVHGAQEDAGLSASLHWEAEVGSRKADIRIYRSLDPVSADSADEMRTFWALRFSPGW